MYGNSKKTGLEFRYPGLFESSASIYNTLTGLNIKVSLRTLWILCICSHQTTDETMEPHLPCFVYTRMSKHESVESP